MSHVGFIFDLLLKQRYKKNITEAKNSWLFIVIVIFSLDESVIPFIFPIFATCLCTILKSSQ
jgi:hypothetical protein